MQGCRGQAFERTILGWCKGKVLETIIFPKGIDTTWCNLICLLKFWNLNGPQDIIHIYIYISICYAILSRRPKKVRQNAASRSWQQVSPCHGVSMCFVHDPCLKFQGLKLSIKVAFHEFNDVGRRGVCVSGVSLDFLWRTDPVTYCKACAMRTYCSTKNDFGLR